MRKRKIALLYLKTGGGHEAAARALSEELSDKADILPVMVDPLDEHQHLVREIIEGGYSRLSSELKFLWPLFYQMSNTDRSVRTIGEISRRLFTNRIVRMIEDEKPDTIVILHFLLIAPVASAVGRTGRNSPSVVTVVLDPFSVHQVWYADNPFPIYCFSSEAVETILAADGRMRSNVLQFPVIISSRFSQKTRPSKGLPENDSGRRILILGGGEGSSSSLRLLRHLAGRRPDLSIDFICGKSRRLHQRASRWLEQSGCSSRVRIHGFVHNIEDYITDADLVLTKAGPASVMECLLLGRPLIIYDYLYGQERGNVEFIEKNNLGCFINTPHMLERRIDEFLDTDYRNSFKRTLAHLNLRSGTEDIVNSILERTAG